jgi:predicted nucleotidyltransferase
MSDDLPTILQRLRALKPGLASRFGVSAIHVFGSRARGEAGPKILADTIRTEFPTRIAALAVALAGDLPEADG